VPIELQVGHIIIAFALIQPGTSGFPLQTCSGEILSSPDRSVEKKGRQSQTCKKHSQMISGRIDIVSSLLVGQGEEQKAIAQSSWNGGNIGGLDLPRGNFVNFGWLLSVKSPFARVEFS
jgi:hypothetical protein